MKKGLIPIINQRNSAYLEAEKYDVGYSNEGDFLEVTEWANGDGVDVVLNRASIAGKNMGGTLIFQMTWGEFQALKTCCEMLYKI